MNFVYPYFLWAFLAVSIPIIIHLFNFRRVKRVYFSNVALLKEVKTETNNFRKIKQFLIMLMRIGFVSFLVLAFAQPFIPSENQDNIKDSNSLVSLYLDNSFSMESTLGNEKYFDIASIYLADLIKVFPKNTSFQLITNHFENKEQYPVNASAIEDRLTETGYSNTYRDLNTVSKRQLNLLERHSSGTRNQIFWFSDFQKSTAGNLEKITLDSNNQYYIIPIKAEKTPNLMVDSVWLANPFVKALESNQISVRLKSFSEEKYDNLVLKLFIDGKQVSTSNISVPPKSEAATSFNFTIDGKGWKACKITFEDFPVVFDNEYFFVLNVAPTVDILNLYDKATTKFVQNVYGNEDVFKLNQYNINSLDYKRIESANLIILNEVANVEGELKTVLQKFVSKGGSLLIFPAAQIGNSFPGFLSELGITGVQSIKVDSSNKVSNTLAVPNMQNPFFKGVFERIPFNMDMPSASAVIRWNNTGEILLNYKNNRPFLIQKNLGEGKIYLCASPLNTKFSDFAKHAVFVPAMYKIASASKTFGERLAYTFQEKTIRLKLNKTSKNQVYKLVKDKVEFVPAQRIVNDELIIELPEHALESGHYRLVSEDESENIIALNYDKAESVMDFYTTEELKNIFSKYENVQIYDFVKNNDFIDEFKQRNLQTNLWKYMLIAALGFALAEILLIRFL